MSDLYLFRGALRDLLLRKKLLASGMVIILPALIGAGYLAAHAHDRSIAELTYNLLAQYLIFEIVLIIAAVVFFTGILSDELEQKTIAYLLTRPIARWRILLAKYLAAFLVTLATVWLALIALALVTYGPSHLADSRLGRDLVIAPLAVVSYGGLFLLLATLIRRPLIWGLFFAFGIEVLALAMPGAFQYISLTAYLRVLAPHPKPELETVDLSQPLAAGVQDEITMRIAWIVLITLSAFFLLAALIRFSLGEFTSRDESD